METFSKLRPMSKILILTLTFFISTVANADVKGQALSKVSEKISNLIPGEGITEVSLDYNDGDEDQQQRQSPVSRKAVQIICMAQLLVDVDRWHDKRQTCR